MAPWIDASWVRSPFSDISETDMDDTELDALIGKLIGEINGDLNIGVTEELINIDQWRENKVDGVNTIYYLPSLFKYYDDGFYHMTYYIGDDNDDGEVNSSDLTFTEYKSGKTFEELGISEIDYNIGKVTLSSAPLGSSRLVWDGSMSPVKQESDANCDARLKQACGLLVEAYAYKKISPKHFDSINFESLKIKKGREDEGDRSYRKYKELVDKMRVPFKVFKSYHSEIISDRIKFE